MLPSEDDFVIGNYDMDLQPREAKSVSNDAKPNVMRSLLDEIKNVSLAAQQKLAKHEHRPLSEAAIEAKAIIQVCEHLLGFILSNDA